MLSFPLFNSSVKSQASRPQFGSSFFSSKPSQVALLKDEIQNVKKTLDKDLAKTKKSNKIWNIVNTGGWVTALGTGIAVFLKSNMDFEFLEDTLIGKSLFLKDSVRILADLTGHEAAMELELMARGHRIPHDTP